MDAGVTRLAQCYEVVPCVGSALSQRQLVVHFLDRHILSFLETQLAERVRLYIAVPDSLPGFSVPLLVGRIPLVPVVDSVFELLMLWAVLLLGKVRTAWLCTGFLWFPWHFLLLPFGQ